MTIYIFLLLFLGQCIYIQKPRNSIQHVSIAKVGPWDFFVSIHIIWEFTRCGLREKTELLIISICFILIGNGMVLRLYLETHAALPQLAWAGESHSSVFLHSERWKTGNCSFTAVPIGGKVDFPVFLRSERRKTGNWSFTAAPIGGKVIFHLSSAARGGKLETAALPLLPSAVMLILYFSSALRGGKLETAALPLLPTAVRWIFRFSSAPRGGKLEIADTPRVRMAEIYQSDFLSFFHFFCFLVGHGSRLSSKKLRMDMYVWKTVRSNNIKS